MAADPRLVAALYTWYPRGSARRNHSLWWSAIEGGSVLEVITGIGGILVGIVSAVIAMRQQRRRELSYGVVARTPLLRTKKQVSKKLKLVFDDEAVDDVYLFACAIENSGNREILPQEYLNTPLRLALAPESGSGDARILTADFLRKPGGLNPTTTVTNSTVDIAPVLLNSGDSMVLQVVVAGLTDGDIRLEARIAGVKVKELRLHTSRLWLVSAWLVAASGYAIFMLGFLPDETDWGLTAIGGVLVAVGIAVPVLLNRRASRRRADLASDLPDPASSSA